MLLHDQLRHLLRNKKKTNNLRKNGKIIDVFLRLKNILLEF